MANNSQSTYWPIPLTLLLAIILQSISSPWGDISFTPMYRPDWLLLALIYWAIAVPQKVSVGSAWLSGLVLDLITAAPLGKHSVSLVVITLLAQMLYKQLRILNRLQQAGFILVVSFAYHWMLIWVDGATGNAAFSWSMFVPCLTSAIAWPFVFALLRSTRLRYNVR